MGTARRMKRTLTFDCAAPLGQRYDQGEFDAKLGQAININIDWYQYKAKLLSAQVSEDKTRVEVTVELSTPVTISLTL